MFFINRGNKFGIFHHLFTLYYNDIIDHFYVYFIFYIFSNIFIVNFEFAIIILVQLSQWTSSYAYPYHFCWQIVDIKIWADFLENAISFFSFFFHFCLFQIGRRQFSEFVGIHSLWKRVRLDFRCRVLLMGLDHLFYFLTANFVSSPKIQHLYLFLLKSYQRNLELSID